MNKPRSKKVQKENLFFGIFFTGWGIYILSGDGPFFSYWGANVSRIISGTGAIFIGVFFLLMTVLKRPGPSNEDFVMCINCKHPFYKKDTEKSICPNCGGRLEDMDGIFDRYPNLRNEKRDLT